MVRESAVDAAASVSKSPAGAQAVAAAKVWDCFPEYTSSAGWLACRRILDNLAAHAVALLPIPFRPWLQTSDNDVHVQRNAVYMLAKLSCWPQGVQVDICTTALGYISNLVDSSDTETRRWSCEFLGNLANYWISLDTDIHLKIISLLGCAASSLGRSSSHSDQDECVREAAAATIAKMVLIRTDAISRRPGILKHLLEHLDSPDARIRQFVCIVLEKFAVYLPTPLDLLNLGPTAWIAPLLSDADAGVRRHAAHALAKISFWRGATEAFDAPTIQLLLDLLK
ncbi:armadillo-type protein [Mycena metata]|uniref:Armadillo-type protein n=1 Tax=Mycena metata TaxID=1033252 RepID=A0AAD7HX11_9AGAR|nr:armadillo-type protein [Mycena metata]